MLAVLLLIPTGVLFPPPVAVVTLPSPVVLRQDWPGRDFGGWRDGERAVVALTRFDGIMTGQSRPAILLPMTRSEFCDRVLTADERATLSEGDCTFTDAAGTAWHLADRGDSVQVAPAGVTAVLIPPAATPEVSLTVDLRQLARTHGREVAGGLALAKLMLSTGGGWLGGFSPSQRAVTAELVQLVEQSLADGERLTLTARPTPSETVVKLQWTARDGSPGQRRLAAMREPGALDWGAQRPVTPLVMRSLDPHLARAVGRLTREFVAAPDDKPSAQAVADYHRALTESDLVIESGPVVAVRDRGGVLAEKHRALVRSLGGKSSYRNLPLAAPPRVTPAGPLTRVDFRLDLDAATGSLGDANLRQATLVTLERVAARHQVYEFGTSGDWFVRASAADPAREIHSFRHPTAPLNGDPVMRRLAPHLPERPSLIAVADAHGTLTAFANYLAALEGALPAYPGVVYPEFRPAPPDAKPCPVVVTVTLDRHSATLQLTLPREAIRAVRDRVVIDE